MYTNTIPSIILAGAGVNGSERPGLFRFVPHGGMTVMSGEARSLAEGKARDLLRALADLPAGSVRLRVAEADGGLACMIQVWPAGELMPVASAERRRRPNGARARCREDVLGVVRVAGRALTRKEIVKALRDAGTPHGPSTVGKALADLTADGTLINPRDKCGYRLPEWPRRAKTPSLF
jgi:hypothetical protein